MVSEELLKILACPHPQCHKDHELDVSPVEKRGDWIVCLRCGRKYPIRDDIPIMLIDECVEPGEEAAQEEGAKGA